jgi:hypothetical protein
MTTRLARVFPLVLGALLLAGCGGGDGDGSAGNGGTIPGAAGVTIEDEVAGSPGPFQSTEFEPPIAFNVPAGWRAQEEFGLIQAFRGAGEGQVLTFETLAEGGDPTQLIEQMRGTPDIEAGEATEAQIGGREALTFEAEPQYATTIEGTEYYALGQGPVRLWLVDVDGTVVAVYAESSVLRTQRREADEVTAAFFNEVNQILGSVEFGSAAP